MDHFTQQVLASLAHMRNDDGGWGELYTQESRITNTCEAVWALSIDDSRVDGKTIQFIEKAIRHSNPTNPQICDISRDYAWCIIALSSLSATDKTTELIGQCVSELHISWKKGTLGRFRNSQEYSTFNLALTCIALGLAEQSEYELKENDKFLYTSMIDELIKLKNKNGGWGEKENKRSTSGYTAYVIYALALFQDKPMQFSPLVDALKFMKKSKLDDFSYQNDTHGGIKPYRHFTLAWYLNGLLEIKRKDSEGVKDKHVFKIMKKLFNNILWEPNLG